MRKQGCEDCLLQVRAGRDQCYAHKLEDEVSSLEEKLESAHESAANLAQSCLDLEAENKTLKEAIKKYKE